MTQEENSVIKECYRILHEVDKTSEELAEKRQCYTCALGRCDETGCYCENAADDFACEDSGCSNYQDGTLSYAKIAEDDLAYLLDHLPCLLNCISEQTARAEAAEKKLKPRLKNRKEPNMNEIERAIELISAGEIDYSGVFDPAINKDVETIILEALREKAERSRAKSFNVQSDMFGEYCLVPTGYSKEKHVYKVVTHFQSNSYCEVPLMHDSKPVLHDSVIDVLNVIHCGIDETKVKRVALRDVELCGRRWEVEHEAD